MSGIINWKKAKIPAIRHILQRFIVGAFNPLAKETEKASIAKPIPRPILLTKKINQ